MAYKLVWSSQYGTEVIEEDIETRGEAQYLKGEYLLAFGEVSITIKRQYKIRKREED